MCNAIQTSLPDIAVLLEPVRRVAQGGALDPGRTTLGCAPARDEPGPLEYLQMLGDRLHADGERIGELVHRDFAVLREPRQDCATSGVGEGRERSVELVGRQRVVIIAVDKPTGLILDHRTGPRQGAHAPDNRFARDPSVPPVPRDQPRHPTVAVTEGVDDREVQNVGGAQQQRRGGALGELPVEALVQRLHCSGVSAAETGVNRSTLVPSGRSSSTWLSRRFQCPPVLSPTYL